MDLSVYSDLNPPTQACPRETIGSVESLTLMASGSDPMADVRSFLTDWYGPPTTTPVVAAGSEPRALRWWYAYQVAWHPALTHQNRILATDALEVMDGKTVFYVENQEVWLWAYGEGEDPEVFDRENIPGAEWVSTGERLNEFLFHVAVFEAVLSDRHVLVANDVAASTVEGFTARLQRCSFKSWRWPGSQSRLWRGPDIVAMTGTNQHPEKQATADSRCFIFVGGKTRDALASIDDLAIDWDYDSRTG